MYYVLAFLLFTLAGWLIALTGTQKRLLHLLQLEDYESGRMLRQVIRDPRRLQILGPELIAIVLVLIIGSWIMFFPAADKVTLLLGVKGKLIGTVLDRSWRLVWFIWGAGCLWRGWRMHRSLKAAKKPLIMTTRAKRIYLTSLIISVLSTFSLITAATIIRYGNFNLEFGCSIESYSIQWSTNFWASVFIIMYVNERLTPLYLGLTVKLLQPIENVVQARYMNDARRIMGEISPTVIGITGSYGKTGTKEMLSAMLAEKYNIFRPPGSYNTLMGVTRVIREQLRPFHELFVAEMGAYRIGSIKKMCNLVSPRHGIITIIGVQHLERFKTRENIQIAKGELIRALPDDGIAVLNGDDPGCREIGAEFGGKVVYFSLRGDEIAEGMREEEIASGDACATGVEKVSVHNLKVAASGSDFELTFPDGETVPMHLSLLGRSGVANAAAAAAMADQLGVPRNRIARALANMPHVKHRLEPVERAGGITVLDDAFNSNPLGAKYALEVLGNSTGGRRILVTPGMVELGSFEEEANYEFGRQAAGACDLVVLVGRRRIQAIKKGLLEAGFAESNISVVDSLAAGIKRLEAYLQPGDTMLLENDLPDQYDNT